DASEGFVGRGEAGAEMVDDVDAIEHAGLAALGDHVFHVVEEAVAQRLFREEAGAVAAAEFENHVGEFDEREVHVLVVLDDAAGEPAQEWDEAELDEALRFFPRIERVKESAWIEEREIDAGVEHGLREAGLRRLHNEAFIDALAA